jgi:microcompartment protein CcmL/EutN
VIKKAIGMLEFRSIAKGIEATDVMLKASQVDIIFAQPICPGKYACLIIGEVSAVKNSLNSGKRAAEGYVVDEFMIANPHQDIAPAITATTEITEINALGIIETFSISSGIEAADIAAKSGAVQLIEIRLAKGLGGKAYVILTGEVSSVKASLENCKNALLKRGNLVEAVTIAAPNRKLIERII